MRSEFSLNTGIVHSFVFLRISGTKLARMFLQRGRASRCKRKDASVRPKTRLVATFSYTNKRDYFQ